MAAIKGKNTTPERRVRSALHRAGFRFRLHAADLPGCPDIVLRKHRTVVFVHGCFWHHHGCANSVWPKARAAFWRSKITANRRRDAKVARLLRAQGWRVATIWECDTTERGLRLLMARIRA
jgi:DNA mismatch endonuclease (patch repair protein)